MFIRFLRLIIKMFVPIWVLSWIVLLPIDAAGKNAGQNGLNLFVYGNVDTNQNARYSAHLILAWIFTFWIFYLIKSEMTYFINARQRFLIDKEHSSLPQANTVLITGVPQSQLNIDKLHDLFSHLPGGVKKIWVNQNLKKLPDLHEDRLKACNKLEGAIGSLIKTATKLEAKRDKAAAKGKPAPKKTIVDDVEKDKSGAAEKLVPSKQRPTHKLGFLGLFGKKVDSINWCREEIARLNDEIDERRKRVQEDPEKYPPLSSCIILFHTQIAAHLCAKSLIHHAPYRMTEKYSEVGPKDIIWSNLNMNPYERRIRTVISWCITIALVIFWAIPAAFVGAVSNIEKLSTTYSWLGWLHDLPSPVKGIIQGVFPPVVMAVLFALVPIILRLLSKFEGTPRVTAVELSLMTRYFIFLVFNGFLIITLASGIISSLQELADASVTTYPTLLAKNLPGASIYFITYITLQGLSASSGGLLQIGGLIVFYIKAWLLGSTPRTRWQIYNQMPGVAWGTIFPPLTVLVVITTAYSVIAPIMNGFAAVAFALFYFTYKYLFLWVYDIQPESDTGGLFFPKSVQHIFTGMYISQICLAALFFLARDSEDKNVGIPEGVLMVILIVITIAYHIMINTSYDPLCEALPLTLAGKTHDNDREDQPLIHEQTIDSNNEQIRESSDGSVPLSELGKSMGKSSSNPSDEKQQSRLNSISEGKVISEGETPPPPFSDLGVSFTHPSLCEPQRTIWAAKDKFGIADEIIDRLQQDKVKATDENAWYNEKDKIETKGYPPGEEPKV